MEIIALLWTLNVANVQVDKWIERKRPTIEYIKCDKKKTILHNKSTFIKAKKKIIYHVQ